MKEIKGLGDRLRRLEELKCELNKIVQEQSDLAQVFIIQLLIFFFFSLK